MDFLETLARRFASPEEFKSSPLYRVLGEIVAEHEFLLRLAARGRHGQYPTFLFFAAVHYVLLRDRHHELARYFPSVVGEDALPPEDAGPAFLRFCREFEAELAELVETRLVQTNNVKRSLALLIGLSAIRRDTASPVHVVEVGASAGVHLRFDRYLYSLAGRRFGDPGSSVEISSAWRSEVPVPDLDDLPEIVSVSGVDLRPLDATDDDDRRWLEALVWPENRHEAELLRRALTTVATDPPPIYGGDAIDVCPRLSAGLPAGATRVAFHAATRMHVPAEQRDHFDGAIASLGETGPLYWLAFEGRLAAGGDPRWERPGLTLRTPAGSHLHLADADGHMEWVAPVQL